MNLSASIAAGLAALVLGAAGPALAQPSGVDQLIRRDAGLAALDRQLADVVVRAGRTAWPGRARLAGDQQTWTDSRRRCLADPTPSGCLTRLYVTRIAQLSSDAGLPSVRPSFAVRCDGDPPLAFTIAYYATDPSTLVAERHGRKIVMVQVPMASGIRYAAAGAAYAEHQGVAWITWPGQPRPLRCIP